MAKATISTANNTNPNPIQAQPDCCCACNDGSGVGETDIVGKSAWGVKVAVAVVMDVKVGCAGVIVLDNLVTVALGVAVALGVLVDVVNGASVGCSVWPS
jgi:hypothetical protein